MEDIDLDLRAKVEAVPDLCGLVGHAVALDEGHQLSVGGGGVGLAAVEVAADWVRAQYVVEAADMVRMRVGGNDQVELGHTACREQGLQRNPSGSCVDEDRLAFWGL